MLSLCVVVLQFWPNWTMIPVVLGIAVPAIAWLEQATLLLLLIAIVLVAIVVSYIMHNRREREY